MNIGIFDSGLGGLSVLKKIRNTLPEYSYIYFADNAHVPYGEKTFDEIYEYTKAAVEYLFQKDCQLIVIACNTATANGLRKLQQDWLPSTYPERRILGVIRPAVETVVESGGKKVGVMATEASVRSNAFEEELTKLSSTIQVYEQACPKFVPLIENGEIESDKMQVAINEYITPLVENNVDTILLGCTHYELIQDKIHTQIPENIRLITEGEATALKLKDYLDRHPEIENKLVKTNTIRMYVTKEDQTYESKVQQILDQTLRIESIRI